mmetsp:Transcript_35103/g.72151  ORF Transcript_35103/g.72151 Transcript_35103/m.72151 type:complete len:578 (-) Transcript_35103:87-1820(-)
MADASLASRFRAPAECQEKLAELHKRFAFSEVEFECFEANVGSLTTAKLPQFEAYLQKEKERKAPKKSVVRPQARPLGGDIALKRQWPGQASASQPKRAREADAKEEPRGALQNAPMQPGATATRAPMQVSTKTSNASSLDRPSQSLLPVKVQEASGSQKVGSYRWINETIAARAAHRDERLQEWEALVVSELQMRAPEVAVGTVGVPCQSESILFGRIACEGFEGRLNDRSIMLEGPSFANTKVRLNVADCKQIAAFPGQIVGVVGRSGMTGSTFHVKDFLPGLPVQGEALAPESSLHAMVVAGPFSQRDRLDFTALQSALAHAQIERPQVLILLGPFVDANNTKVMEGEACLSGSEEPACLEEVYVRVFAELRKGLEPLRAARPATQVFILPSLDEAVNFHPLPQPPMDIMLAQWLEEEATDLLQLQQMGVRFLSNPAHVELNGIKVSITSADALSPILREMVLRPEGRKVEEALQLLLKQRCLFPAVPRDPAQVYEAKAQALDFPWDGTSPQICIFPSPLAVMNGAVVENTLFVNPGALCRQAALGSFAELWIQPAEGVSTMKDRVRLDLKKLG